MRGPPEAVKHDAVRARALDLARIHLNRGVKHNFFLRTCHFKPRSEMTLCIGTKPLRSTVQRNVRANLALNALALPMRSMSINVGGEVPTTAAEERYLQLPIGEDVADSDDALA